MNKDLYVILGLGATGLSCARFLSKQKMHFVIMDTRKSPPNLASFQKSYDIPVYTGEKWPQTLLNQARAIVVSPGISTGIPPIVEACANGVEVIGDVELFARFNHIPVIAITGANGKSTVTTIVGEMARNAGKNVAVIGNIGTPVLDALFQSNLDLVVMELSSFQLETTYQLRTLAATVLNITPDHLDRYAHFNDYVAAKHRIYEFAEHAIINKQDPLSDSNKIQSEAKRVWFTLDEPSSGEFGIIQKNGERWLAFGKEGLLPTKALKLVGVHNWANALSALALGWVAKLPMTAMLKTLQTFTGLDHRCQWVAQKDDITWINDSKGTNVGACEAAIKGIGAELSGKIILLLGGEGKGADFTSLSSLIKKHCRIIILMGKDAPIISQALEGTVPAYFADNMQMAVELAAKYAKANDCVLLSPACASLDQYKDFAHRGEVFTETVKKVLA